MIEIRNVSKSYGAGDVLSGVTLVVRSGEIVALLGANGSGKTTLFRCLLGLTPFAGEIRVEGIDPRVDGKRLRSLIGFMPQGASLHRDLSVAETIRFYSEVHGRSEVPGLRLLTRLGLDDSLGRLVGELSGGMQQRLSFAVACLNDPAVLLLDEPSAALDRASRAILLESIRRLADRGTTILLSTHVAEEFSAIADHYFYLDDGMLSLPHDSASQPLRHAAGSAAR